MGYKTTLCDVSLDGGHYGIAAPAVDFKPELPAYLRITDINDDGTLNSSDRKSVDDPSAGNYLLHEGDIVFARTGNSTGRNYYYDPRDGEYAYAGFLIKFSLDPRKINPRYMKYYAQSKQYWDWVSSFNTGSTRGNINAKTYASMPIDLPSRQIQDGIVAICNAIDDKIRINRQLNDYLLELATVRFEQELVKESKTYRFSELIELEDSKRVPLNSRDRKVRKGSYPYYGATSIMDYVDDYLFDGIRVLLGEDGTVIREDGKPVLQYVWDKYWVNNHAHILKSKADYSLEAIYIALARTTINHIVTGAVQMKISQKNLNDLELEMPTASSLDYLEDIFALYRSKAEESKKLGILRDALLPKLMSGEIDASKVDLTQLTNNHLTVR